MNLPPIRKYQGIYKKQLDELMNRKKKQEAYIKSLETRIYYLFDENKKLKQEIQELKTN